MKIKIKDLYDLMLETKERAWAGGYEKGRADVYAAVDQAQEESFAARKELADLKAVPFSGQEMKCGLCKASFGPGGGVWKFKAPADYRCTNCAVKEAK